VDASAKMDFYVEQIQPTRERSPAMRWSLSAGEL
jgi:hypothetical protein